MRIALAQINPTLGDFEGNSLKILDFTRRALDKRASLVVFPEMCLFGYPAYDLLERIDIVEEQEKELKKLIAKIPKGITTIFGAVIKNGKTLKTRGKPYLNVAVVARKGTKTRFFPKQLLPSYDVFDDTRFFESGEKTGVITIPHIGKTAITICEDMWFEYRQLDRHIYKTNPLDQIRRVKLIVNISASPFSLSKLKRRLDCAKTHVKLRKSPFVYVNQVGGQDELIFDGRSFILDHTGKEIVQAAACEEDLVIVDLEKKRAEYRPRDDNEMEQLRQALVLGLRDFLKKTGQTSVHLGLSGGIDSALVAALAVDAVGSAHVTALLLPGPFSSRGSVADSLALAKNLKIKTHTVSILELNEMIKKTLGPVVGNSNPAHLETMQQNIQARLRGLILMSFSNATGSLLLTTVNKSEMAVGYGTMYGDLCGGLAPIADLVKGEVYRLARHYNRHREVISEVIINKEPSAELAPNQKDQDTLPPYDDLDKAIINLVEKKKKASGKVEKTLIEMLFKSEWKRWQTPPVLRVTDRAFGKGRRMPISGRFRI